MMPFCDKKERKKIKKEIRPYLIIGALEIDEHFSNKDTPAAASMAMFHLCQPSLYSWFVVFFTQKELRGITSQYILERLQYFMISSRYEILFYL